MVLPLAGLLLRIVALFNPRLKRALDGRKGGVNSWRIKSGNNRPVVLIHASSRGELEGAIPLIETLSESNKVQIALSYSSPSAEKLAGSLSTVWTHGYMPFDYLRDQVTFLGRLEPSVLLIFKHDFWPNTIRAADALGIPVILVNANFHTKSKRNLPIVRSFNRRFMKSIKAIWTVSEQDADRVEPLLSIGTELEALGDTRYDRVRQRASEGAVKFNVLKRALGSEHVIVLGSSWLPGELIFWEAYNNIKKDYSNAKIVIAPHEPTEEALQRNKDIAIQNGLKVLKFSAWDQGDIDADVLLIDKMGVLAGLYAVGWSVYVGGGFGVGVHSVIEPAAHKVPVMFGPNHHMSHEASLLLESGGGYVVETASDVERLWRKWLEDNESYQKAADSANSVVTSREGVTYKLIMKLEKYLN